MKRFFVNKKKSCLFVCIIFQLSGQGFSQNETAEVCVIPSIAKVRVPGTWKVIYKPGSNGIKAEGGIKVRFPKGFGKGPIHVFPMEPFQIDDSTTTAYVTALCTNDNVGLDLSYTKTDSEIWWDWERWSVTFTVKPYWLVEPDTVDPVVTQSDSIILVFGANPPHGSVVPPFSAFTDSILIAADEKGIGKYYDIYPRPLIHILPDRPHKLRCLAQSTQRLGIPFGLYLFCLDQYNNLITTYPGTIELTCDDPKAEYPKTILFQASDNGKKEVKVNLNSTGVFRFQAKDRLMDAYYWDMLSNPIEVIENDSHPRIYWGDLHSHSAIGHDAYGRGNFEYARDIAKLDFYSLTDHSTSDFNTNSISDAEWNRIKNDVIRYHEPGKFIPILGYEISFPAPSGHHNVYIFTGDNNIAEIPIIRRNRVADILEFWSLIDLNLFNGANVFTIAHHTGILWNGISGPLTDFGIEFNNSSYRAAIEVYSSQGSSEMFPPREQMSYGSFFPGRGSAPGPHYLQDALALENYLGVFASSDDHSGRPGISTRGLTAIQSGKLSSFDIYEALKNKSVYATTGERIIMRFMEKTIAMGEEGVLSRYDYPEFNVEVHGTGIIEWIELLKWDFEYGNYSSGGHPIFSTVDFRQVNVMDTAYSVTDSEFAGKSVYYLRVKQRDKLFDIIREIPGTFEVWAWSSPIWIDIGDILAIPQTKDGLYDKHIIVDQNYPNPFNARTKVDFVLPEYRKVKFILYNSLGQQLQTIVNDYLPAGKHSVSIDAQNLTSGIYFYRFQTNDIIEIKKMVVIK